MEEPTPGVDPKELDAFLATAPESLRAWADAQRDAISSGPGVEELEDAGTLPDEEPQRKRTSKAPIASGVNKVLVALLAAAIVLLIQQWGRTTPTAAPSSQPSMQVSREFDALDEKKAEELKKKAEEAPTDPAPLRELAKLYHEAGLWQEANEYQLKVLKLAPDDFDALLAVGVFYFNTGDLAKAEQHWVKATEVSPDHPEGYFNLGFVYLAKEPAEKERAVAAWKKVIEVAPESDLAKTAKSHIDREEG